MITEYSEIQAFKPDKNKIKNSNVWKIQEAMPNETQFINSIQIFEYP